RVWCRDPEETGDFGRLHHLRTARHAARDSLSPRRRGVGDRHEPRRLRGLLRGPDRRRGVRRPVVDPAVFRDVDTESHLSARRAADAAGGAQCRQHGAWRRLGRGEARTVWLDPENAKRETRNGKLTVPFHFTFRLPHFALRTLDRYVVREWLRVFLITLIGFPILVIVIDLTDKLDQYLGRGIKPGAVALSYVFDLPEKMFLILPVAVLFATVFTVGSLCRP